MPTRDSEVEVLVQATDTSPAARVCFTVAPTHREAVDREPEAARVDRPADSSPQVCAILGAAKTGLDEHEAGLHEHNQKSE